MQTTESQAATPSRKRNGGIDLWKFIFSIVIVLFHFSENLGDDAIKLFSSGSIAVEFFFVVSGFLMFGSSRKYINNGCSVGKNTRHFLLHKISNMLPEMTVAWIIGFIVLHLHKSGLTLTSLFGDFLTGLWELLFVQFSGLSGFRANTVTWYISAMLLVMLVLFPLLIKNKSFFINIIAPATVIFMLGYLCANFGNLQDPSIWLGFCNRGLPRAFAEIALGCICFPLCQQLKQMNFSKLGAYLLSFFEMGGYLLMLIYSYNSSRGTLDFAILFCVAISITITFSEQSSIAFLFNHSVFSWLGKISFPLFLGHRYWGERIDEFFPQLSYFQRLLVYSMFVILTTAFIYFTAKAIRKCLPDLKKKCKQLLFVTQS